MRIMLLIVLVGLLPVSSILSDQGISSLDPDIGATVVPRGDLDTWENYPTGLWGNQGKHLGIIKPAQQYTVISRKVIYIPILGNEHYLQLIPSGSDIGKSTPVWVFQGKEGSDLPPNLIGADCTWSGEEYECKK